ncbi:MAG TPA: MATE family efflux transporter [Firmicutes bacterium]|nr:MATE family efflux transporter [Bacillota bacterium]
MSAQQEAMRSDPNNISQKEMRNRIFAMVWPATIENVLQMAVGMVSSAMLGRVGKVAIGSVGLGRRITMLVWGFFAAIGTGTTVMVARSVGANDRAKAGRYAEQAFVLALSMVLAISVFVFFFARDTLVLLYNTSGELLNVGTDYLRIAIWGVPFMAIMQITGAIMRGAGNTKVPMQVATVINMVNVVLSYALIFGHFGFQPMGVIGAAWASNIAQATGTLLALFIMLYRQDNLVFKLRGVRLVSEDVRALLGIGLPTAAENILMQLGQIMLTGLVVSFGDTALAAHQQGLTAESLSYMPAVGFSVAATAFVGQSMGAGSTKLAERYVKELAKWSLILTAFTASFLVFTPKFVFGLLTNVPEVIELGAYYLILMGLAQIPQQLTSVFNGALRGAGDTKAPMVIGALGLWGIRLPFSYFLSLRLGWGIVGVWAAMTMDLFVRFSMSSLRFYRGRWKQQLDRMVEAKA